MLGQEGLRRELEFILSLASDRGYTKESLMNSLGISDSTFRRYIANLKDLGFAVVLEKKYYKIDSECSYLNSLKSASLLSPEQKKLFSNSTKLEELEPERKAQLLDSMNLLFEEDPILYAFVHYNELKLITELREVIHQKKSVCLMNYRSSHSQSIGHREVEPFKFTNDFKAFWAFDVDSETNKLFKISRFDSFEIKENWKYEYKHKRSLKLDIFNMNSSVSVPITARLSLKAHNYLIEETSVSRKEIQADGIGFLLNTKLHSVEGFKRFYLGLPNEIELVNPENLEKLEALFVN